MAYHCSENDHADNERRIEERHRQRARSENLDGADSVAVNQWEERLKGAPYLNRLCQLAQRNGIRYRWVRGVPNSFELRRVERTLNLKPNAIGIVATLRDGTKVLFENPVDLGGGA